VTFNVQWTNDHAPDFVWSDTVWVFVDYNKNGVMERLPVTGATAIAGTVTKIPNNDKGVWVAGNARSAGNFSATVQLLTATADLAGACVYSSNYPPVGEYTNNATEISFTGTAPYTVVLENSSGEPITYTGNSPFPIPGGCTVKSFTDKTGAPGKIKCMPMTGTVDFSAPLSPAKSQPVLFTVNANLTAPLASARTYTWSAPNFNPSSGTGTSYAPTAPSNAGAYTVTLTVSSEGYCDLVASKTVTVTDCNPSSTYTLLASAASFCAGDAGVTFSLSGTDNGRSYQLYNGATTVTTLTGTGSAAPFSGNMTEGIYTAKVLASAGGGCEATMSGTPITISRNPLPAAPVIAKPDDVCLNDGSIVFTATSYSGSLTWTSNGGGVVNGNSVTFSGTATGTKTVAARSAQTYTNAPTCYSAEVTQSASVLALPATPTLAVSASTVCLGTNIVFRVTVPESGATYTWSGAAGTASGTGDGSYMVSGATTGTVSVTAYARLTVNETTCQSGNISLSGMVSQPGADGQAADPTCHCASGLSNCSGTCTTPATTYKDAGCTGVCNLRSRNVYNECGVFQRTETYTDATCTAGCGPVYDPDCFNTQIFPKMSLGESIGEWCRKAALQYKYYNAYVDSEGGWVCLVCN
jgi:hypothetical protein